MKQIAAVMVVSSVALFGCSDDSDPQTDDTSQTISAAPTDNRELSSEVDGVRAEVADCFVVETADGLRRYQTTIEIRNESNVAQAVTVTVVADLGRGGVSDTIDVPAGASDAFAVTADETTDDEVGDAECTAYIEDVEVTLTTDGG